MFYFFNTARFLSILLFTLMVCSLHVNSVSVVTSKYLAIHTLSILKSLIFTLHVVFAYFLPNTMKLVLLIFRDSLFMENQMCNFLSSIDTNLHSSAILSPVQNTFVSSAKIINSST